MNEITLTVIAQIVNFFLAWYIFHVCLLKKVFDTIRATRKEITVLDHSITLAQDALKAKEKQQREKWNTFLIEFSQKMPSLKHTITQQDITPLCPVAPGLNPKEKDTIVHEVVTHLVRKITYGK